MVKALLPRLTAGHLAAAPELAGLPERTRGFRHVTLAILRDVLAREATLVAALEKHPDRHGALTRVGRPSRRKR